MIDDILQNFDLRIDGYGYAGKAAEVVLPKITPKMQEYMAGGMSGAVGVPMGCIEKMEAEMTLKVIDPNVLKLIKVTPSKQITFDVRGAVSRHDGAVIGVKAVLTGYLKEVDLGTWKPGEETTVKIGVAVNYYKLEREGKTVIEVDPLNMVFVTDGADQLSDMRRVLGR